MQAPGVSLYGHGKGPRTSQACLPVLVSMYGENMLRGVTVAIFC